MVCVRQSLMNYNGIFKKKSDLISQPISIMSLYVIIVSTSFHVLCNSYTVKPHEFEVPRTKKLAYKFMWFSIIQFVLMHSFYVVGWSPDITSQTLIFFT